MKFILPQSFFAWDNSPVREIAGSVWTIVESTRLAKSMFLKNFLSKRFPNYVFSYQKFVSDCKKSKTSPLKQKPDGVVAELKSLSEEALRGFDKFTKEFRNFPIIMILTPAG